MVLLPFAAGLMGVLLLVMLLLRVRRVRARRREMVAINRSFSSYVPGGIYRYESPDCRCVLRVTEVRPGEVDAAGRVRRRPRCLARVGHGGEEVCITYFTVDGDGSLRGGCDYDPAAPGARVEPVTPAELP